MVGTVFIYTVVAIPVLIGLRQSQRNRNLDRRHFASFVGFCAALVALITATIGEVVSIQLGVKSVHTLPPLWIALMAILSLTTVFSSVVALASGLFTAGPRRWFLVAFAAFMAFFLFITGLGRLGT